MAFPFEEPKGNVLPRILVFLVASIVVGRLVHPILTAVIFFPALVYYNIISDENGDFY